MYNYRENVFSIPMVRFNKQCFLFLIFRIVTVMFWELSNRMTSTKCFIPIPKSINIYKRNHYF